MASARAVERTSDVCTGQFFHVITDIILMVGCIISILIPVAEKYITRLHRLCIFLAAAETLITVLKKKAFYCLSEYLSSLSMIVQLYLYFTGYPRREQEKENKKAVGSAQSESNYLNCF